MKPKVKTYAIITGADNNIVTSVTLSAGGTQVMTMDGAIVVSGVVTVQELGYAILITSAGNDSGITFTVVGTDVDGGALTEVITGPNATTAVGASYFRSVTSITASGDTAAGVEIGTSNATRSALTPTYALDIYSTNTSIDVNISGTINYDVLKCHQRPTAGDTLNFIAGGLAAQTADGSTAYTGPTGGVRTRINSYTNGATLIVTYSKQRIT
jgi:hypothetical protein